MHRQNPLSNLLIALFTWLMFSTQAMAADPMARPDGTPISLSGTVVETQLDGFMLDYGEGLIRVEMDDWDWYRESYSILEGDNVRVHGRIDNTFVAKRTIEAESVYVQNLNTYFFANDADEEDVQLTAATLVVDPLLDNYLTFSGEVTEIDGREFTLDTGDLEIQVDTKTLGYNPLDDKGFQKLKKGDRVMVSGPLDIDLFEENEILADYVVTLSKDKTRKSAN